VLVANVPPVRPLRSSFVVLVSLTLLAGSGLARANGDPGVALDRSAQSPTTLSSFVTLPDAIRLFREHGFDRLLADAATLRSEGDVSAMAHVANPGVSFGAGRSFNVRPNEPAYAVSGSLDDNGAIFDVLTGKRSLRGQAASAALQAARSHRASVELGLEGLVKQAYVQVAFTHLQVDFTKQQVEWLSKGAEIARLRHPGVIDDGALARIEVEKLEADQAATGALASKRLAQVALALLIGVRGPIPDFDVDRTVLAYRVPASLAGATEASLVAFAMQHRPVLAESRSSAASASATLSLEKRRVFPEVTLGVTGSWSGGVGPTVLAPPTVGGSVAFDLPLLYQRQGEVRRAEADLSTRTVLERRAEASVVSDVTSGFAAVRAARSQVERMLGGGLLDAAKIQRDVLQKQFDAGSAKLTDYLDAQRTFAAVQLEYLQHVADFWTAVFQLERAIGAELP
jgi:cobalt-zinc-cadmium efflux system outer membrane protein